jgi:Spy/CpxP family protein refolding chaperone
MRVVTTVLTLAVSLVIVGNLLAAEEKGRSEGRRPHRPMMGQEDILPAPFLKGLNLTDDQKAKLDTLKKEYAPKFKEGWEKMQSVLTADQKKARDEAVKAAEASGKTGRDAFRAAHDAVKLTDEQKAKMDQVRKDNQAVRKEARDKAMAILTPEQQDQLKKEMKERRERRSQRG